MSSAIKILIADDEADICYFLSRNLEKRNFTTSIAHTLADADKLIKSDKPAIILLDNHLPDGMGISYAGEIKSTYPDIKIVMITAHDSNQDRAKAYDNGVDFFLSKPFTITEVNRIVDLLLSKVE